VITSCCCCKDEDHGQQMRILDQFRRRSHRGVSCSLAKLTPQSTYRSLFSLFSSLASSGSHKLHKADSLYNY
jgi:hypothetical protein